MVTSEEFCYLLGYLFAKETYFIYILFWSIIFDSACVFIFIFFTSHASLCMGSALTFFSTSMMLLFLPADVHLLNDPTLLSSISFSPYTTLTQGLELHSHVERLIRAALCCSSACYRPAPPPPPLWDNPLAEWSGQRQPTGWEEPLSSKSLKRFVFSWNTAVNICCPCKKKSSIAGRHVVSDACSLVP